MTLLVGTVLGLSLGCALTLTYGLKLGTFSYREDFDRLPRMALEATDKAHGNTRTDESPSSHSSNTSRNVSKTTPHFSYITSKPSSPSPSVSTNSHPLHKKLYLVILLSYGADLTKLETIYDTWGRDLVDLKFFVSSSQDQDLQSDGMPIIRLPGQSSFPSKWHYIESVLDYVYRQYSEQYNWFVLVNHDVYLSTKALQDLFLRLNPTSDVYMGTPVVPVSHQQDDDGDENKPLSYCHGQSVVLSQSVLSHLVLKSQSCVMNDEEIEWDHRVGKCLKKTMGLQCGEKVDEKVLKYFAYDVSSDSKKLWEESSMILDYLTFNNAKENDQMYSLHYLYKLKELSKAQERATELNENVKSLCQSMPHSVLEDETIEEHCTSLRLKTDETNEKETDDNSDSVTIPVSKFHPHNRFQVQSWHYFDAINIYEDENSMPRRSLRTYKYHSIELQKALQEAVKAASRQHHAKLRFKKILNGYVRHNPLVGNEYIIDAKFVEARHPRRKVEKRIKLLRPLASSYIVLPSKSNSTETIHFVVPITRVNQRLVDFLEMYEKLALRTREKVHLVLSVYGANDIELVRQNVTLYSKKYPKAEISVVQGFGEFSRGKALDLGMSNLKDNDLAFFCDIDMTIDRQFLKKCRRNTIQGTSVYYPEVFKLYNRKYVYRKSWHPSRYSISREQGHWGYYAYGMLCIYKSDYKSIGGLDTGMIGWGGEDVDLYERVLKSGLDVLRSPDTSLLHRWHSKSCKMQSSDKMLEHCLMSQAEVLADRRELARYIFDIQGLEEEYSEVTTAQSNNEKKEEESQQQQEEEPSLQL